MDHSTPDSESSPHDGNGSKWTKGLIAGISLTLGVAIGIVGMGTMAGRMSAKMDAHLAEQAIHISTTEDDHRIRDIIDREIAPALSRIESRLARVEVKLDDLR